MENKPETKPVLTLEIEKNGRLYAFSIPVGAPFGEAYDAAYDILNYVVDMAREAASKAEPKRLEEQVQ